MKGVSFLHNVRLVSAGKKNRNILIIGTRRLTFLSC